MLVLSRCEDQEIVITAGDEEIVLTVVDIRGSKVRLGVEAGPGVVVNRREVHETIKRESNAEQQTAAASGEQK